VVEHLAGLFVAALLQVCVGEVVEGVHLGQLGLRQRARSLAALARRLGRKRVRVDRLVPHPDLRKDVRRHVERVGERGCDLEITMRGFDRFVG
jgi:hypothetical protein